VSQRQSARGASAFSVTLSKWFNASVNYPDGQVVALSPPSHLQSRRCRSDDIAVLNASLAPDTVHNFIVQRDANVAGENGGVRAGNRGMRF